MDALTAAIIREMRWHKAQGTFRTFDTIYWGGGTPSLLEKPQLILLFEALNDCFQREVDAEITLECNPDDIKSENLNNWKQLGINRLSIGIQSFHAHDLAYLDRLHDVTQALRAVDHARSAGFENLSIDLIYGIPGQTMDDWKKNLAYAIELQVPHISAYALTIEDRTILKTLIDKGKKALPTENKAAEHFMLMHNRLQEAGYEHYEISNFAKPVAYARHNSAYWDGSPYLGLGPSAHSYDGGKRWWNVSKLGPYIQAKDLMSMQEGEEVLSKIDRYNEYVMTHLRTMWGCRVEELQALSSEKIREDFERKASDYVAQGWMKKTEHAWVLTPPGMLLADGLASSFFLDKMDDINQSA